MELAATLNCRRAGGGRAEGSTRQSFVAAMSSSPIAGGGTGATPASLERVTAFVEKMQTEAAQVIYRLRGAVAEFPNAWLKAKIGLRQFRVRGLKKVRGEALWACLAYNLLQWVRLRWKVRLAEAKS